MNPYDFVLIANYPDSSMSYRINKTYKNEKTARNQVAKLTQKDDFISYVSVKQVMDLDNWELNLPTK